jgi:hypothetical protein
MAKYNISLQENNADLQGILDAVRALPDAGSVELPELTNEGTSIDLLSNKQLIDQDGNIVTGSMANNGAISQTMDGINIKSVTIPSGYTSGGTVGLDNTIDDEVDEQADLIAQIKTVVNSLPEAGSGEIKLQSKNVTPAIDAQTVVADDGYDGLETVEVNAIPSDYIKPNSIRNTTVYTPGTANQIIPIGTYCSGNQTIKGDSNLISDNIVEGVTIFGVTGSATSGGSGGGDSGSGIYFTVQNDLPDDIYVNGVTCLTGQSTSVSSGDGMITFALFQSEEYDIEAGYTDNWDENQNAGAVYNIFGDADAGFHCTVGAVPGYMPDDAPVLLFWR